MAQLEKDIENDIVDLLRYVDIFAWPNNTVGIFDPVKKIYRKPNKRHLNGVSDILACIKGRMVAIEVKSAKGVVRLEQRMFLARLNQEGGLGFVTRSVHQCVEELSKHFPEIKEDLNRFLTLFNSPVRDSFDN